MKQRPTHRPERLAELIRQTVAAFLTGNVRDPRIGFITVTGVAVSADLSPATVSVSVMGTEGEKETSPEGLAGAPRLLPAPTSRGAGPRPRPHPPIRPPPVRGRVDQAVRGSDPARGGHEHGRRDRRAAQLISSLAHDGPGTGHGGAGAVPRSAGAAAARALGREGRRRAGLSPRAPR